MLSCQSTDLAPAEPELNAELPVGSHCVCLAGRSVSVKPLSIGLLISRITGQVTNQVMIQKLIKRSNVHRSDWTCYFYFLLHLKYTVYIELIL